MLTIMISEMYKLVIYKLYKILNWKFPRAWSKKRRIRR